MLSLKLDFHFRDNQKLVAISIWLKYKQKLESNKRSAINCALSLKKLSSLDCFKNIVSKIYSFANLCDARTFLSQSMASNSNSNSGTPIKKW